MNKLKRRLAKLLRRKFRSTSFKLGALLVLCCAGVISYAIYMENRRLTVDTASAKPLLELIADVESKGNYNAYFGAPNNSATKFTDMTVAEVQQWQASHVANGHASSAVGRYQIIDTTLAELVAKQNIDTRRKFDAALQDSLAIALLERRGSEKFVNKELTAQEFAANLAMEWASLPRVIGNDPEASYYGGDGLNQSLVGSSEVLRAVNKITPR